MDPQPIKLSFPFTLRDRISAAFAVTLKSSKLNIFACCLGPIVGLLFLGYSLAIGSRITADYGYFLAFCFLLTPFAMVFPTVTAYYTNKLVREPFTVTFDQSGIHTSSASTESTHRWFAITRVVKSRGFLLFFFSPNCAHTLPLRVVREAGVLEPLFKLADAHGVRGARECGA